MVQPLRCCLGHLHLCKYLGPSSGSALQYRFLLMCTLGGRQQVTALNACVVETNVVDQIEFKAPGFGLAQP